MSVFSGGQYPGAMRDHREEKRLDAEERNARTPDDRRSKKVPAPLKKKGKR